MRASPQKTGNSATFTSGILLQQFFQSFIKLNVLSLQRSRINTKIGKQSTPTRTFYKNDWKIFQEMCDLVL